ncbi:hypothetical protein MSZK_29050 [Mycobacterium sp. shizuoka-1]|nr:hypothetical protein MSZK_29050 [Mycobacterium sp. shizuoka-1]
MGSGRRSLGATLMATATICAAGLVSPASAHGAPPAWTGRYQMITYASQKAGTSPATRQRENDFGATFTVSTACTGGACVATVVDGPAPSNPTIPQPTRYTWNGSEWATTYDWVWDCFLGDGYQKQWSPATSWAFYEPQPDGSLRGTWHTDIAQGPCRGSVVMPVAAFPA